MWGNDTDSNISITGRPHIGKEPTQGSVDVMAGGTEGGGAVHANNVIRSGENAGNSIALGTAPGMKMQREDGCRWHTDGKVSGGRSGVRARNGCDAGARRRPRGRSWQPEDSTCHTMAPSRLRRGCTTPPPCRRRSTYHPGWAHSPDPPEHVSPRRRDSTCRIKHTPSRWARLG